jgi:hypothetical protein
MKYFLVLFICSFLFVACGNDTTKNEMRLMGEVKGLKKGTLFLQKLDDTTFISLDSMVVDGSPIFSFSEEITAPEVYYLTMTFQDSSNVIKRLPFFAEAGDLSIYSTLENFGRDAVIKGSVNQEKMDQYAALMKRFKNQNLDLIETGLNAMKDGNDSLSAAIRNKQDRLLKSTYLASVNFAMNHSNYEVAPYIMLTEVYDLNTKYLDTVYGSLTPKIKDSKYGKALESFIQDRKN